MSFSPCGSYLAAAAYDYQIDISDVYTGEQVQKIVTEKITQLRWQPKEGSSIIAFARDKEKGANRDDRDPFVRLVKVPQAQT